MGSKSLSTSKIVPRYIFSLPLILSRGVNVNSQHDINGWTALHWAAKRNHLNIVNLLCNHG